MKNQSRLFLIVGVLCGLTTSLKATYYQETFFPIGLTGINPTGWDSLN